MPPAQNTPALLPYQTFPLITVKRVLLLLGVWLAASIFLLLLPSNLFQEESWGVLELKLLFAFILLMSMLLWSLLYAIPYALWIRKTGKALPYSPRLRLFSLYHREIEKYNATVGWNMWGLWGNLLNFAGVIIIPLVVVGFLKALGIV